MVYSRPWKSFPEQLELLKSRGTVVTDDIDNEDTRFKSFLLLAITRILVKSIYPNTQWHNRLAEHLGQFPQQHSSRKLDLSGMGMTKDWRDWW